MSEAEQKESFRKCANCGAKSCENGKPLKKCSRCLSVKYCSPECQRKHWKKHKPECNQSEQKLPPGVQKSLPATQSVKAMHGGYRIITVKEPDNVLGCCWCCAMLLKVCGPQGMNPSQDIDGPFWTSTFGRSDNEGDKPFPAAHVLGEPGSTGYFVPVNQHGQAAACIHCAHGLQKDAEAHIEKCEGWLKDDKRRGMLRMAMAAESLPKPTDVELRAIALIALDQTPDLSHGPQSIAGYFSKGNKGGKSGVPFTYKNLEEQAFPLFLVEASGFKGKTLEELIHYTKMRLYSAEKTFRENSDYVVFSVHRMAAYGEKNAIEFVKGLPTPLPPERANEIEPAHLSLRPGFL